MTGKPLDATPSLGERLRKMMRELAQVYNVPPNVIADLGAVAVAIELAAQRSESEPSPAPHGEWTLLTRKELADIMQGVLDAGVKVKAPKHLTIKFGFSAFDWETVIAALRSESVATPKGAEQTIVEVFRSRDGRVFANVNRGGLQLAHLQAGEKFTLPQESP